MASPLRVSVVVPSHDRPVRLRWLLNALEEQTLPAGEWELVVVHDSGDDTERVLSEHPLARAGRMRHLRLARNTGTSSRQRNTGWREARARLVAFTDDDCRPERGWLAELVTAADLVPGAIVQGTTRPDPYEQRIADGTPRWRSLRVEPPSFHCPTCNVLYEREALEAVGGFVEQPAIASGEDTDLALRVRATGRVLVGAPGAVVNHAIEPLSWRGQFRVAWRWQHIAYVARHHREARRELEAGLFWNRAHALLALALAGGVLSARHRAALVLALPYLLLRLPGRGLGLRETWRAVKRAPGDVAIDSAEMAALVRGSVRYRWPVL
ncbi:MAG: hypothetical protein JWM71_655 [Solirubrobacteraceae bacterium]|nr:hypothetical protein [Solirubrobacteraceae bacterium]